MYKQLLVPTDGSECSTYAVTKALEFAKEIDAKITFLYAVEDPMRMAYSVPEATVFSEDLYKGARRAGMETLAAATALAVEAGVAAGTILAERKHPVTAILEAEKDFDLVIIGTHGRRGLRHLLLGSVTEEVIRQATVPFMVIRLETT